ncbi:hypothetical protein ACH4UM_30615 [Streptomyces sp. NPDC020801]|uniref:hypothetical protein n=1 Tax=unclassified Streptomyces TaxID=2593676 RepID=UPI00378A52DA
MRFVIEIPDELFAPAAAVSHDARGGVGQNLADSQSAGPAPYITAGAKLSGLGSYDALDAGEARPRGGVVPTDGSGCAQDAGAGPA